MKTFSFELIYCFKICFEIFFAECQKNNTRQRSFLPSVKKKTLGKEALCQVSKKTLGKEPLCRVSKKTLGKGVFAECPKNNTRQTIWHSAKSRSPVVRGASWFAVILPTVGCTIAYCCLILLVQYFTYMSSISCTLISKLNVMYLDRHT